MIAPTLDVEVAFAAQASIGEGPRWDERTETIIFVDIAAERVLRYQPATRNVVSFDARGPASAIGLCDDDNLVLARGRGFAVCKADGADLRDLSGFSLNDQRVRLNDGAVDPWGRFLVGSMDLDARRPIGALYRLDADGAVEELLTDVTISNGIAWNADAKTMYYVDSVTNRLDAFALDADGDLSCRRPVIQFDAPRHGGPDGIAVDGEGCIWVACWGGSAVRRITPDGRIATLIHLPVTNVTGVAFGGSNLDDLYITSARAGLDERALAAQPHAGDLFVASPGVAGFPFTRFAAAFRPETDPSIGE